MGCITAIGCFAASVSWLAVGLESLTHLIALVQKIITSAPTTVANRMIMLNPRRRLPFQMPCRLVELACSAAG
jgi:hypothetical protein